MFTMLRLLWLLSMTAAMQEAAEVADGARGGSAELAQARAFETLLLHVFLQLLRERTDDNVAAVQVR